MKSVGVIVEYNPFHNGHHYHIKQSLAHTDADIVIAVMSGNFLQRGEPALVSKWIRTKMALQGGADIVVELPYAFATGKAEIFANGAVSILDALGTDVVCFGSEQGTIEPFEATITFLKKHQEAYRRELKMHLDEGHSFPKAASLAFQDLDSEDDIVNLSMPNNILGFHYVKAIYDQQSTMGAATIPRISAGYHDDELSTTNIASATGIRKAIATGEDSLDQVRPYIPAFTYRQLQEAYAIQGGYHHWETFFPYLQYRLLTARVRELEAIYEAEEGLQHRLIAAGKQADNFASFMEQIKTKRYTWARLQRLCVHILTNTTKQEMESIRRDPRAPYIRLLGMSEAGQAYLNAAKKKLKRPLVSTLSRHQDPLLELDKRAADCYALGYRRGLREEKLREDYATPPVHASDLDFTEQKSH